MKLHRNVTPRQEQLAEKKLFAAVAALRTPEECRAFFRDLCTPAELQAMADRWAVVEYVQKGLPYREIHRLTGVSVTTIGRVARFVATGNGGYQLAARRVDGGRRNGEGPQRAEAAARKVAEAGRRTPEGTRRAESTSRQRADSSRSRPEASRHG